MVDRYLSKLFSVLLCLRILQINKGAIILKSKLAQYRYLDFNALREVHFLKRMGQPIIIVIIHLNFVRENWVCGKRWMLYITICRTENIFSPQTCFCINCRLPFFMFFVCLFFANLSLFCSVICIQKNNLEKLRNFYWLDDRRFPFLLGISFVRD